MFTGVGRVFASSASRGVGLELGVRGILRTNVTVLSASLTTSSLPAPATSCPTSCPPSSLGCDDPIGAHRFLSSLSTSTSLPSKLANSRCAVRPRASSASLSSVSSWLSRCDERGGDDERPLGRWWVNARAGTTRCGLEMDEAEAAPSIRSIATRCVPDR